MFTGIISDKTTIKRSNLADDGLAITFARPKAWKKMALGESVATNGVCLTVSKLNNNEYECFLMPETLQKTSFGTTIPKEVNLERPMSADGRFGGHFVQGHVDCVGTVSRIATADGWQLFVDYPVQFADLVIPKGSIAIDGVSLTVVEVTGHTLSVALIPHTLEVTTLKNLKIGDTLNLEFDMIGKYVVNILSKSAAKNS